MLFVRKSPSQQAIKLFRYTGRASIVPFAHDHHLIVHRNISCIFKMNRTNIVRVGQNCFNSIFHVIYFLLCILRIDVISAINWIIFSRMWAVIILRAKESPQNWTYSILFHWISKLSTYTVTIHSWNRNLCHFQCGRKWTPAQTSRMLSKCIRWNWFA